MTPSGGWMVGDALEQVALQCDPVRILRFGATTHNAHRIHYDTDYARAEGLPDPVVMAQLQGTLFFRAAARLAGEVGAVTSVTWRNRAPAPVGCVLTVSGTVTRIEGDRIEVTLVEHADDGALCAEGSAVITTTPRSSRR
ncbi:acyl dehydratase [Rhodococcus sp. IEGM 1305]|uniref:acyl dehydratase n=1 Tax=Rhodococcus sp. IEGM 1305 TaxID=3047092 RepID=UPI0024B82707|nr:acyl dehydratase [Rhodococcus sp. IEGM 1305]MDI9949018.1 acyl dehydratase [Rhodococcus sp. IEGM 1305]